MGVYCPVSERLVGAPLVSRSVSVASCVDTPARYWIHAMAGRICALRGKECASTCSGCFGTKHACTPSLGGPPNHGVFSIANSEPLKAMRGEGGRLLFSGHEKSAGFVCEHAAYAAQAQWKQFNPDTPIQKKARGRPKKLTPDRPATRAVSGPVTPGGSPDCWSCLTGPRAHLQVKKGLRPLRANSETEVMAEERAAIMVTGCDWGIKQYLVDGSVDPSWLPRVLHGTAGLHMWFSGSESYRDKLYDDLSSIDTMTSAQNVMSAAQEVYITTPQARTTKMIDSVKKYNWALGVRAILTLVSKTPDVDLATLTPEDCCAKLDALVGGSAGQHCRLRAELEALYDWFVLYDFWRAARKGCTRRAMCNFLELGPLMWSCTTDDKSGALWHPKKAEEWLSDCIVLAMCSERMYSRLANQIFSKYRMDSSDPESNAVPAPGDDEYCVCGSAGHCVTKHAGHKNFRDANNESTNIVIKEKGGTEEAHERRSKNAIVADQTLAPHRRAPEATSRTEQPTTSGRFRGCVYGMVEQLERERPWNAQIPTGRRIWVSAAAGARLASDALELRKVRKKRRTEHKRTATDKKLMRALSQVRAADATRSGMEPRVGSAAYFRQGGLPANPDRAYTDSLLQHRQEDDGSINEKKVGKSWKVATQAILDEQIDHPGRGVNLAMQETLGSIPKVKFEVKQFGNDESDLIGTTKKAKNDARALRDNAWWETPRGMVTD